VARRTHAIVASGVEPARVPMGHARAEHSGAAHATACHRRSAYRRRYQILTPQAVEIPRAADLAIFHQSDATNQK
jgi:hypothetical protein